MKSLLLISSFLLSSCSCDITDLFNETCFKNGLIKTIEHSTKIVVTEHSHETDFNSVDLGKLKHSEITYHQLTLNEDQKRKFILLINSFSDSYIPKEGIENAVSACMYEPHHTIMFYKNTKLLNTLDICFVCMMV